MKRLLPSLAFLALVLLVALPVAAQQHKRNSPHDTISTVIDDNRVTIVYGRPYTKDPKTGDVRKIWGGLIPFDKVWRTGADEATLLITQKPIVIGSATVPAGAYTLWTLPRPDGSAVLIINRQIGQWGIDPHEPSNAYDDKQDLARVPLKHGTVDTPVDQFTIDLAKNPPGGLITLTWENTQYSVPFSVKK